MRDQWLATNISEHTFTIGDLPKVPTFDPNQTHDLLRWYSRSELESSSHLLDLVLTRRWVTIVKVTDGTPEGIDHTNALTAMATPDKTDVSSGGTAQTLNRNDDNNTTLGVGPSIYFVPLQNGYPFSVTLPDVEVMENRELTFIVTTQVYESWFTINGPLTGGGSFTLSGLSAVKLISDGTNWSPTSYYND